MKGEITMFMEVISIVNELWFNDKISWRDKEKINSFILRNSNNEELMRELYEKYSNYLEKMDAIPENGITF